MDIVWYSSVIVFVSVQACVPNTNLPNGFPAYRPFHNNAQNDDCPPGAESTGYPPQTFRAQRPNNYVRNVQSSVLSTVQPGASRMPVSPFPISQLRTVGETNYQGRVADSLYAGLFPHYPSNGHNVNPSISVGPTQVPPTGGSAATVAPWRTVRPVYPGRVVEPTYPQRVTNTPSSDRSGEIPLPDSFRRVGVSLDYEQLPPSYKAAFMSVNDLVNNKGLITPPGQNYRNTKVVFDNQTKEILDASLEPLVSNILPTIVAGTWRSMTLINGCCPVLRYHAANETLANINGRVRQIVHFDKAKPPKYQFIAHGLCAYDSYSTNGHCLQGTVAISLLVYDLNLNPPLSFDIFNIPSYCNCFNY